jgi:hypothetical protein
MNTQVKNKPTRVKQMLLCSIAVSIAIAGLTAFGQGSGTGTNAPTSTATNLLSGMFVFPNYTSPWTNGHPSGLTVTLVHLPALPGGTDITGTAALDTLADSLQDNSPVPGSNSPSGTQSGAASPTSSSTDTDTNIIVNVDIVPGGVSTP